MSLTTTQVDPASGIGAKVDADGNAIVTVAGRSKVGANVGGGPAAGPAIFSENDGGSKTGDRRVSSPETDNDSRLRVATDHMLDRETFNYGAHNTGKHSHTSTTITATVGANGLLTNSGSGVATGTGMTFGTWAEFPCAMTGQPIYCETTMALNVNVASIPSNAVIDVGMFRRGVTTAFAPVDGVYFRFTSAGITAVLNNNAIETTQILTGVSGILANEYHLYSITINEKSAEFWIDNIFYAEINTPIANAQSFRSATLPWSVRHANTGAVGAVLQSSITDYMVSIGGVPYQSSLEQIGNRALGAHQGLSGNTMGALSSITGNSQAVQAATASNTAQNATGLGGLANITASAAAAADFLMTAYQVPAGSIAAQGRRLTIKGVKISGANLGAAVATTPTAVLLGLAFGATAASLATADSGSFVSPTIKGPRREALGFMYWPVAAAIGATPQNGDIYMPFASPIYVNPGEWIATYCKFVAGTATAAQTLAFTVTFDYGWE